MYKREPGPDGNAGENWSTAVNADDDGGDRIGAVGNLGIHGNQNWS